MNLHAEKQVQRPVVQKFYLQQAASFHPLKVEPTDLVQLGQFCLLPKEWDPKQPITYEIK